MKNAYLCENIELRKRFGVLVVTEWIAFRGFGKILSACIFLEDLQSIDASV
jgi:hypothetical protein